MLLQPIRIARPDLRADVQRIVDMIRAEPDGQQISLTELVRILGITIAPDFHARLDQRGQLVLHRHRFENQGPAIRRKVKLVGFEVSLDIAPILRGHLARENDGIQLAFDTNQSVSVSKFLFNVQLRVLDLNHQRIHVDFAGAQDVIIDLTAPV